MEMVGLALVFAVIFLGCPSLKMLGAYLAARLELEREKAGLPPRSTKEQ